MKRPGPYEVAGREAPDEHPVDRAIERRIPMKKLRRQIRTATGKMTAALGDRARLWLRLEELLGEYRGRREEAYFDLGHEHGAAGGRAEALRSLALAEHGSSSHARAFTDAVRDLAAQADLPRPLTVAALLEIAWAFSLDLPNRPKTPTHKRK